MYQYIVAGRYLPDWWTQPFFWMHIFLFFLFFFFFPRYFTLLLSLFTRERKGFNPIRLQDTWKGMDGWVCMSANDFWLNNNVVTVGWPVAFRPKGLER